MLTNENRNKKGRGFTKYYYTVKDVAKIADRAEGTIRNAHFQGRIDLTDPVSVFKYCFWCRRLDGK